MRFVSRVPLAFAFVLVGLPSSGRAQEREVPAQPVTIIVVPDAAAEPSPPIEPARRRGSVGAKIATLGAGIGMLAGGWVVTFIVTIGWYFDTTDCRGASVAFFGPDPDGPYHCVHRGPNDDALGASFIPVIGPWVMLNTPNVDPAFPIAMGVLQAAGVLTLAIGAPLVWSDDAGRELSVDVRTGPGGAALMAQGRF